VVSRDRRGVEEQGDLATDEVRESTVEGLKGGLGEHIRDSDPCVLVLGRVEIAGNGGQTGGDDGLTG